MSYSSKDAIEEVTLPPAWGIKEFSTWQHINFIHLKHMFQKITSNLIYRATHNKVSAFKNSLGKEFLA